jgi:hypothetical protein
VKARTAKRTLLDSVPGTPGSVRHSLGVLAAVAFGACLLLGLTDGVAAAATGLTLVAGVALVLGRYAAGGAAQDRGHRDPQRLLGERAPTLGGWRSLVADTLADDSGEHLRTVMRPQLQRLFAARLAQRHGVAMHRNTQRARALVGDRLWPWIDPGASAPRPTLPEPVLRALLDRLETL